jgi:sulfur-oxidizing protein SoxX
LRRIGLLVATAASLAGCVTPAAGPAPATTMERPLTDTPGDAERGREVLLGRDGNCLLCHAVPETGARFMGNLGPPLSGVASRMSVGEMRLRLVDSRRVNPETIMPSYHSTEGLVQVAAAHRGKTVLSAQQIEDVLAYLSTLR